jgi:2-hydroxy-6-oxonona-2,4-dienedioate hydrolase
MTRHPDRVSALILLVPLAYKTPTQTNSAPPLPAWVENTMMLVIGSDFLFWVASHVARDQVIKVVLATPPKLLSTAKVAEQTRINLMLETILPVAARAAGLRSDTNASAENTASKNKGAKFIGFETGGHTWVGHNDEVMAAIAELLSHTYGQPKP